MWISNLRILNLKSVADSGELALSRGITVLIGPNNAGKSTILKALYRLQSQGATTFSDVRQGVDSANLVMTFEELNVANKIYMDPVALAQAALGQPNPLQGRAEFSQQRGSSSEFVVQSVLGNQSFTVLPSVEPRNFIYPYLSKRKVPVMEQTVNVTAASAVHDNLSNLIAKIDELRETQHPAHREFAEACRSVLGFEVSTFMGDQGKQAGLITGMHERVPLSAMGEGTAHVLGLIVRLCVADQQLFLIEEIENDIHPKALKGLLRLIAEKSRTNQFVLSTHSNIVTKYLGSEPDSVIYSVTMEIVERVPTTSIRRVGDDPLARREVLEDLGYESADLDIWKGYVIFEESSAERIVRDHLVRWFAPGLIGKLRTIAAVGVGQVEPKFEDLNRLFLFTHLEPAYRNRAWVVADGDAAGKDAVAKLEAKYGGSWEPGHFRAWSVEDFEAFYPAEFAERATAALAAPSKQALREAKRALLEQVLAWIGEDDDRAKTAFEKSAEEVAAFLREIEGSLA